MKKVNTFIDFRTELVKESSKKAESEELKKCLEVVLDDGDDVTIDATPLSSKSPTTVDYKIYQEGKKSYSQIFRADGNSQIYLTFNKLLKNFNREDLEVLWRLVKSRFEKGTTTTTPTTITTASSRPKAKGLVIHEQEQAPISIVSSHQPSQVKDKGKGKMVEQEPMKKLSKKDQLMLDEELAFKL
nr:hypothetical protein [Tanacetum cinerariifolium]